MSEESVDQQLSKHERDEYIRHAELRGQGVWISQAARKYGVSQQLLSKWTAKGYIAKVGSIGNKVLLDEADVAYCVEVYSKRGGPGKWLFKQDGTPYTPKTTAMSASAARSSSRRL